MLRRSALRFPIFSSFLNPALEQASVSAGYDAPLWVDSATLQRHLAKKNRIVARRGEAPTPVTVQQKLALFNLDQLRAGPRGVDFARALPRGVKDPTDAATLQPFRGAVGQQLEAVAANNRWGPFWLAAPDVKWRGFFPIASSWTPSAWKTVTTTMQLFNFSQLDSGAANVALATVPVNFRYAMLMLGTDLAEQLRNEALRRNLQYPVVSTSKMVELCGCTVLPERVEGFKASTSDAFQSRYRRGALIFNLDEFECGAKVIESALQLPAATEPTLAFSGAAITRQIIVQDAPSTSDAAAIPHSMELQLHHQKDKVERVMEMGADAAVGGGASDAPLQAVTVTVSAPSSSESGSSSELPKYTSKFWLREYEAGQLSNGDWKLKPNARGALLGESLIRHNGGGGGGGGGGGMKRFGNSNGFVADSDESSESRPALPRMITASQAAAAAAAAEAADPMNAQFQQNNQQIIAQRLNNGPLSSAASSALGGAAGAGAYYFDCDIKERKEFLAALGTYVL